MKIDSCTNLRWGGVYRGKRKGKESLSCCQKINEFAKIATMIEHEVKF